MAAPNVMVLHVDDVATPRRIMLASTWWTRAVGLLGTSQLDDPCGLWILPCSSVHMIGMRYPIDVVYLSEHGKIVKIVNELKPWRLSACWGGNSVLELRAGLARVLTLKVGQVLSLQPIGGGLRRCQPTA